MAVVRHAVFVRHHANHFIAPDFSLERASHPAVAAGSNHGALGRTPFEQAFFHQRVRRTSLHAGAARDAFRLAVVLMLTRGNERIETSSVESEGECSLAFVASPNASRAENAASGIEGKI